MKKQVVKLNLKTCPDNLKREGYALFAPINEDGQIGLGAKTKWYPEGIYRLAGGGIDKGEDPAESAIRELKEELSINTDISELIPLIEIIIDADTEEGNFKESFHCYAIKVSQSEVTAGDDIDGVKFMTKDEYEKLNSKFESMDVELKNVTWDIERWKDYGTLFGTIQRIVGEELTKNNLW
jgi:8-oxo-dGTP pyrophosphatase MutT (NUDIX family)